MLKRNGKKTDYWVWKSPVGRLLLVGNEKGLSGLHFQDGNHPQSLEANWTKRRSGFQGVIQQLNAYFQGELTVFRVKLALQGTPFQLAVWKALTTIPYGQTASYGEIACQIGNPKACRAVGAANGMNPVSIIVPCHRVIGKGGNLVGFGGGLGIKQALLDLEQLT